MGRWVCFPLLNAEKAGGPILCTEQKEELVVSSYPWEYERNYSASLSEMKILTNDKETSSSHPDWGGALKE